MDSKGIVYKYEYSYIQKNLYDFNFLSSFIQILPQLQLRLRREVIDRYMSSHKNFKAYGLTAILTSKKYQQDSQQLSNQTEQYFFRYTQTNKCFKFYVNEDIPIKQQAKIIPYLYSDLNIVKLYLELDYQKLEGYQKGSQVYQTFLIFIDTVHKSFRFISQLGFANLCLDEILLKKIKQCDWKFLTSLILSFNKISHEGTKFLSEMNLKRLKRLNLSYNNLGNGGIVNIYKCHLPNLNKLDIRCTNITYDVIKVIEKYCNKLESLALGFSRMNELFFSVRKLIKTQYKKIFIVNENEYIINDVSSFWYFSNLIVKSPHFNQNLQSNKHWLRLPIKGHSLWHRSFINIQMKQKIKIGDWVPDCNVF